MGKIVGQVMGQQLGQDRASTEVLDGFCMGAEAAQVLDGFNMVECWFA